MKKQFLLLLVVAASFIVTLTLAQTPPAQKEKQPKSMPVSDTSKPGKKSQDTVPPKKDTTRGSGLY